MTSRLHSLISSIQMTRLSSPHFKTKKESLSSPYLTMRNFFILVVMELEDCGGVARRQVARARWSRNRRGTTHGKFSLDVTCPCMPAFWPLSGLSLILAGRGQIATPLQIARDRTCGNFRARAVGSNGSNKMSE
jgi:hypothetical protein